MDSVSSAIIPDIEKIIAKGVEQDGEIAPYEERPSTFAKRIYALSQELRDTLDAVRNIISSSNKKRDTYIDDSRLSKLSSLISNYLDTAAKTLYYREWQAVREELLADFWGDIQYDSNLLSTLFKNQRKEEAIAVLSSIKLNALNTIRYAVIYAYSNRVVCILRFDEIQTIAIPITNFVFNNDNATAIIFTATYNKAIDPIITTSVKSNIKVEHGIASLTTYATTPGIKILSGTASMQLRDTTHTYPWQTQYYVAPKGIYMHIDNANKCYAGIAFSMTIGVDEYGADKLLLRSKNAVIKKITDSIYSITAPKGVQSFMVYMDAVNKDGSISQSIAAKHIKVLQPIPDIAIGNIQHGLIAKGYIQQHPTLSAIPRDEELDITYYIKQYTISSISKDNRYIEPITINSSKIDTDIIQSLHSGDRLLITDIIATDNYGNIHRLPGTTFRVE